MTEGLPVTETQNPLPVEVRSTQGPLPVVQVQPIPTTMWGFVWSMVRGQPFGNLMLVLLVVGGATLVPGFATWYRNWHNEMATARQESETKRIEELVKSGEALRKAADAREERLEGRLGKQWDNVMRSQTDNRVVVEKLATVIQKGDETLIKAVEGLRSDLKEITRKPN
jgi:hypothetical protein